MGTLGSGYSSIGKGGGKGKSQLTYSGDNKKGTVHSQKNPSGSAATGPMNKAKAPKTSGPYNEQGPSKPAGIPGRSLRGK